MKIYGHFFSAPANQVRLTASALGLEHDYHHVDLQSGEQKSPEFLAINPFGKVPALEDDGYKLAESNAICRYMACKQDGKLYSQDLQERAQIDQWMDFASLHVRSNMAKVLFNKMLAPLLGVPVDEKAITEGQDNLTANLAIVDDVLGKNTFIAGEAMTIADTAMIAAMEPFEKIGYDVSTFQKVQAWRQQNMAQDWYKNVHAHYAAEIEG